jgi:hypothetical protein
MIFLTQGEDRLATFIPFFFRNPSFGLVNRDGTIRFSHLFPASNADHIKDTLNFCFAFKHGYAVRHINVYFDIRPIQLN